MFPKRANIPLQGLDRHALKVGAISGPTAKLETIFGIISPVLYLHSQQKHSGKAHQSTISSGGSEQV